MAISLSEEAKLLKQLGKLDHERRLVLHQLKRCPTWVTKWIEQGMKVLLYDAVWMKRVKKIEVDASNESDKKFFMKLHGWSFLSATEIRVEFRNLENKPFFLEVLISATRPLEPQIYQNLEPITEAEMKTLDKFIKSLEKERKKSEEKEKLSKELEVAQKLVESLRIKIDKL